MPILDDVCFTDDGKIIDYLSDKVLMDTPEERVRQRFIKILHSDYGYPKNEMLREVPIQRGSKIQQDQNGNDIRADIVVYKNKKAALNRDQGNILFVVECKKKDATEGYAQLVSYIFNTSAIGGVWTNGNGLDVYRKQKGNFEGLEQILSLPKYKQEWNDSDYIPNKQNLPRPHEVRFLLTACHNKLYGRGMENDESDLTMDMVRILLAKIQDETSSGQYPRFWITDRQHQSSEGRKEVANEVQSLFREYADLYPDIFGPHEKITVGPDCIAEVVGILKDWALASKFDAADDWDLMGEAYEQFTRINLKRQQGQFFTNRLVVNMMVKILNPVLGDRALDPAGGSGGFVTAIFRHLRHQVVSTTQTNSATRDRQIERVKNSVFMVESSSRLVKVAKCAMLLTGDGQCGMTKGNSLDDFDKFDDWIKSRCARGKSNAPNIIATNPPFAGQKIESQISDKTILSTFAFGHSYKKLNESAFEFSSDDKEILHHQAPELLFLERCMDWLKPGGRMGIVLPKGILDNISYEAYRYWILERYELNGVVTLHKDTFQPDTGVRTCVLFLSKPLDKQKPRNDYPIFMAISERIGQDSKGKPIFVLDGNGNSTGEINHDLNDIADAYESFRKGKHKNSEYVFAIERKDIKDHLNINPQHYSPKLNAALNRVLEYDNKDGWATTTVGQLESGIKIYIGPRWNSTSIKVDNPKSSEGLVPYLTANAALELRRFTIKWLDVIKASEIQKQNIEMLKIKEGDILISRSGTIGKVTYATKDLAENYIVSDDLVRIRVRDANLRAYLLAYFTSKTALSLMLLDEYGSVQQHLQPRHIQEMLIPIPEDWECVSDIVKLGMSLIKGLESLSKADRNIREFGFDSVIERDLATE